MSETVRLLRTTKMSERVFILAVVPAESGRQAQSDRRIRANLCPRLDVLFLPRVGRGANRFVINQKTSHEKTL
jgi:hypothetical protein